MQRRLVEERSGGLIRDRVLLLEHPPVVTVGRGGGIEEAHARLLAERGIRVVETDRGGKATYHGPGQLVAYPILDLRARGGDAHAYLRKLETVLVEWLRSQGVRAFTQVGLTGVWTERGKIASIGVGVSRGVTFHGFALNIDCDLGAFYLFEPCGFKSLAVTSVLRETSMSPGVDAAAASMREVLNLHLGVLFEGQGWR